jgi:hypothetical protein
LDDRGTGDRRSLDFRKKHEAAKNPTRDGSPAWWSTRDETNGPPDCGIRNRSFAASLLLVFRDYIHFASS